MSEAMNNHSSVLDAATALFNIKIHSNVHPDDPMRIVNIAKEINAASGLLDIIENSLSNKDRVIIRTNNDVPVQMQVLVEHINKIQLDVAIKVLEVLGTHPADTSTKASSTVLRQFSG